MNLLTLLIAVLMLLGTQWLVIWAYCDLRNQYIGSHPAALGVGQFVCCFLPMFLAGMTLCMFIFGFNGEPLNFSVDIGPSSPLFMRSIEHLTLSFVGGMMLAVVGSFIGNFLLIPFLPIALWWNSRRQRREQG